MDSVADIVPSRHIPMTSHPLPPLAVRCIVFDWLHRYVSTRLPSQILELWSGSDRADQKDERTMMVEYLYYPIQTTRLGHTGMLYRMSHQIDRCGGPREETKRKEVRKDVSNGGRWVTRTLGIKHSDVSQLAPKRRRLRDLGVMQEYTTSCSK